MGAGAATTGLWRRADEAVRSMGLSCEALASAPGFASLVCVILVAGAVYGACMGTYRVFDPGRLLMVFYAAVKVPLLIATTTALCLPGFFVLNTVAGLRDDFARAMRAVLTSQGAFAVVLLGLAPVIMFLYACGFSHKQALLANIAAFCLAAVVAQLVLLSRYRSLRERNPRHGLLLFAWAGLYAFVGTQAGWMLRPFVGVPDKPVTFFRQEPFSNAYVALLKLVQ